MISFLCFSKNRPLQLDGYIRSLKKRWKGQHRLSVLYTCDPEFVQSYRKLERKHSDVEFIWETNFQAQVRNWVKNAGSDLIAFGCDDVVFTDDMDESLIQSFFKRPSAQAFSLRLGLNITWSYMANKPAPYPTFLEQEPYLVWRIVENDTGWRYTFELDGSVYRKEVVQEIFDTQRFKNPNSLEGAGVNGFYAQYKGYLTASFRESKLVVVTVNAVQTQHRKPRYYRNAEVSPEAMLEMWNAGKMMDIDAYSRVEYNTFHISDCFTCITGVRH